MTARERVIDALRDVYDPCCADRGISVVDMGLVEDVRVDGSHVQVDIVLTTGWCPFVASMSDMIPARLRDLDGRRERRRRGGLGPGVDDRAAVALGPREALDAHGGAAALPGAAPRPRPRRRLSMATTETTAGAAGARERKVPAFVFDCVCHIFNFDKRNALGPPGEMFDEHLYAFHQFLTKAGEPVLGRDEFFKEWSVDEIYDMVIEGSDTDMIVAQPLPLTDLFHDGLSPVGEVRRDGGQAPRPGRVLGLGQPAGGQEGPRPDDPPGRGPRRQGVQVLQRPLRLRAAVPVAHGRPARGLPGLRARAEARREPDRRPQGRARSGPSRSSTRAPSTWTGRPPTSPTSTS